MRWLDIDSCPNLRDIGGYTAGGGRRVRTRVVYRGGALTDLSAAEGERLAREFGVRTVVDLREDGEGPPVEGPFEVVRLPTENPDPAQLASGEMGELYLWNLEPRALTFVGLLEVLAEAGNLACVVQCSGGKDRTGILVALLLELLGVDDDIIVEEYALTDEALLRQPEAERASMRRRAEEAGYDPEVLRARPATMRRFLEGFREKYGDAATYAQAAGATEGTIDAVRANLLTC